MGTRESGGGVKMMPAVFGNSSVKLGTKRMPQPAKASVTPAQRILLKYFSLAAIVVQTTVMVFVLRYSKVQKLSGKRYLSSTAITCSELVKALICFFVLAFRYDGGLLRALRTEVFGKPAETCQCIIPAGLYTIQNNILFLALGRLDAATYQVTYQLKILTAALFSVLLLKRRFSLRQWLSLVALMFGVILVQLPHGIETYPSQDNLVPAANIDRLVGVAAVMLASLISGFASVFVERLLKQTSQDIWIRNTQMVLVALVLCSSASVVVDFEKIIQDGYFQGYNVITWIVVVLQAVGGFVVAYATKYADAILKGFATSISIVMSTVASWQFLHDFEPSLSFFVGAALVIGATVTFGFSQSSSKK